MVGTKLIQIGPKTTVRQMLGKGTYPSSRPRNLLVTLRSKSNQCITWAQDTAREDCCRGGTARASTTLATLDSSVGEGAQRTSTQYSVYWNMT